MSANEHWHVNDLDDSAIEHGPLGLLRWWYSYENDSNLTGKLIAIRDLEFVIELVREIERLQTENINLADAHKHRAKLEHSVISLSEISKQQPFHMEPEE